MHSPNAKMIIFMNVVRKMLKVRCAMTILSLLGSITAKDTDRSEVLYLFDCRNVSDKINNTMFCNSNTSSFRVSAVVEQKGALSCGNTTIQSVHHNMVVLCGRVSRQPIENRSSKHESGFLSFFLITGDTDGVPEQFSEIRKDLNQGSQKYDKTWLALDNSHINSCTEVDYSDLCRETTTLALPTTSSFEYSTKLAITKPSTAKNTSASSLSYTTAQESSTQANKTLESEKEGLGSINSTSGENVTSQMKVFGDDDAHTDDYEEEQANATSSSEADALGGNKSTSGENVTSQMEVLGDGDADAHGKEGGVEETTVALDLIEKEEKTDEKNGKKEDDSGTSYVAFIVVGIVVIVIVIIILAIVLARRMAKKKKEKQAHGALVTGIGSSVETAKTTGNLKDRKEAELAEEFNLGQNEAANPAVEVQHTTEEEVVGELNHGDNEAPKPAVEVQHAIIPVDSAAQEGAFKPAGTKFYRG